MAEAIVNVIQGQHVYSDPFTIPNQTIPMLTALQIAAGEVVFADPFFGVLAANVDVDGEERALGFHHWFLVRKQVGQALTKGDPITFKFVAAGDYWEADLAVALGEIHAWVMKDELAAATTVFIRGPLEPPFSVL